MSDKESKKAQQSYYDKYNRNKEAKAFYNSKAWRELRPEILRRDNHTCQACWAKGKYTMGNIVHHKIELMDDPTLGLVEDNLETVCHDCHEEKHPNRFKKDKPKKKRSLKVYKA